MIEIKKGYKQTEVGVIPGDWEVKPLGTFTSILVGRDLKEGNYSTYQDDNFKYPVFSNTVSNYGLYGFYDIAEYNGDSLTIVGRGVGLGTAFSRSGGYGAIGRLLVLFPDKNIDANFLTEYINHKVKIFSESGGIPQLTGLSIAKYRIPLPPTKSEQTAIATVLSDTDVLIERLEKLIAKKKAIKQGAMQQLLTGKKRLPGFSGEWEVKKLGEVVEFSNGKAHENFISDDGEYIVVNSKFISSEGKIIKYSKQCFCPAPANSILLVMSDVPNGKAIAKCFLVEKNDKYTVNQRICILCPKIDAMFLFYKINRNQYYLSFDDGVKQTNLRKEDVLSCKLSIPKEVDEQTAIAAVLSDMDAEIDSLEQKRDKYTMLKQGMMQELLTGRIRLVYTKEAGE